MQLLDFSGWMGLGVRGFTTTRHGGRSIGAYSSLNLGTNTGDDPELVLSNRRAAYESAGLDPAQGVFLRQVHGNTIVEAKLSDAGRGLAHWNDGLPDCDAVFTKQKGLVLNIGHADCLAVVLADVEAGLLGLAHAGWRGALATLPALLARRLLAEGAQASRLRVILSPCLSPSHLELGAEQYQLFDRAFPHMRNFAGPLVQGSFHLDLQACVSEQLLELGLSPGHIVAQALCSYGQAGLFFSYRRDKGDTGRMLTTAYLS